MLRHPRAPWVLLALLTIAHLAMVASFVRTAYSAPDADGYYAQARLLALEGRPDFQPESPVQHLGIHWLEKEDGRFVSRYPPGLSIVVGAVWKALGRDASLYVNAVLAALTLPLVFLLCRPYGGDWLAFAGALLQAANPAANAHSLSGDSHTLTTFCLVLGLVLLDHWRRHGGRWTAFAGGFALAYIPLVRFAEGAAALGVLAFLALVWKKPERRGEIAYAVGGAMLPTLVLAAHNQYHFGAFWRTAYGLTGESDLSLSYLLRNWSVYGQSLLTSGVGYFVPTGVVGMIVMWRDRELRPFAAAVALIAGAITFLYCCYYFAVFGSPVTVRFLLPTLPLYLPPAFYLLRTLLPLATLAPAAAALVIFQVAMGQPEGFAQLKRQAAAADRSAAAIIGLEEFVPAGSVVFGDRRLNEQIHFTGEWKLATAELITGPPRRRGRFGGGRFNGPPGAGPGGPPQIEGEEPDGPSPMQPGKGAELRARYDGLSGPEKARRALEDAEEWAGDQRIYLVMTEAEPRPHLPRPYELELTGRIEMPQSPEPEPESLPRRGPPGMGRGRPGGPRGDRPAGPGDLFGLGDQALLVYRVSRAF